MIAASRRSFGRFFTIALGLTSVLLLAGCASTGGGSGSGLPPIPEGKGRLMIEAGGINPVNYFILDQETDEEVYSDEPRVAASSPSGFERGGMMLPQMADLPPGKYTIVVNTDIQDSVELTDFEIVMGETRYAQIPVGRFQILFFTRTSDGSTSRQQIPFLIYDYNMNTVLGKGMTSTEVRYFIVPVGNYKVRLENYSSGLDQIRPVQVSFGRPQNITIGPPPAAAPSTGEGGEGEQP